MKQPREKGKFAIDKENARRVTCPKCGHIILTASKVGSTNCVKCRTIVHFDPEKRREYRQYYLEHLEPKEVRERRISRNRKYYYSFREEILRKRKETYAQMRDAHSLNGREYRKQKKLERISQLGGKCSFCGYNKYTGALDLHHLNPEKKERNADWLYEKNWDPKEYLLLCKNCHFELHAKMREEKYQNSKVISTPEQTLEKKGTFL